MKHHLALAGICASLLFSGCQDKEKLSADLSGVWTSLPEKISVDDFYEADMIRTYEFTPDEESEASGSVVISAMISADKTLPATDSIVQPISISAAAIASVKGKYEAISYDKVIITPDASSFTLSVDPSAVKYSYNVWDGEGEPDTVSLRPVLAKQISDELTGVVRNDFARTDTLTDVKVKRAGLSFKAASTEFTLEKQPSEQ